MSKSLSFHHHRTRRVFIAGRRWSFSSDYHMPLLISFLVRHLLRPRHFFRRKKLFNESNTHTHNKKRKSEKKEKNLNFRLTNVSHHSINFWLPPTGTKKMGGGGQSKVDVVVRNVCEPEVQIFFFSLQKKITHTHTHRWKTEEKRQWQRN